MCVTEKIKLNKLQSYSIIAMNLETVNDVEKVIRQCETLKVQMTGGSVDNLKLREFLEVPPMKFIDGKDAGDFYPVTGNNL